MIFAVLEHHVAMCPGQQVSHMIFLSCSLLFVRLIVCLTRLRRQVHTDKAIQTALNIFKSGRSTMRVQQLQPHTQTSEQ